MNAEFILLSLKHSVGNEPTFWCPNNAGYTNNPWNAGIYNDQQIKEDPDYYNNGYDAIPIPLSKEGLNLIGFKCTFSKSKVNKLLKGR